MFACKEFLVLIAFLLAFDFGEFQREKSQDIIKEFARQNSEEVELTVLNYKDKDKISNKGVLEADHLIPEDVIKDAIKENDEKKASLKGKKNKRKRKKLNKTNKKLKGMLKNQFCIALTVGNHQDTESWGNREEAKNYRQDMKNLLAQGKIRDAIDKGVQSYKKELGNKFDTERLDEALRRVVTNYQGKGIISKKAASKILHDNNISPSTNRESRSSGIFASSGTKNKDTRIMSRHVRGNSPTREKVKGLKEYFNRRA